MTALAPAPATTLPCRDDPELFFPRKGKGSGYQYDRARAMCRTCPIQPACLADAMTWPPMLRKDAIVGGVAFDGKGEVPSQCRMRYPQGGPPTWRCTVRGPHAQHQMEPIKETS
jgi:hypothetical protein